jgi:malonate transporter and related proteins
VIETLTAIAPVFLIIVIGYVFCRTNLVRESVWSAIEHICFYLLFPFLIVRTLGRADLTSVPVLDFLTVLVVAIAGMSLLLLMLRNFVSEEDLTGPTFTSLFQGATRFHGFMALAVIAPLYGDDGITLTAIALSVMVPLLNAVSVIVLSVYATEQQSYSLSSLFLRVLKNPLIIACGVGLIVNFVGVPNVLFNTIEIIGSGGLGLALLCVGAGLRLNHAAQHKLLLSAGVLIRLLGMPSLIIFMSWIVGLDGLPRTVAIIAGAVPTAASAYVMARKMGGDAELMSNILTFQVLGSFITLPVFIYLAEAL